MKSQTSNSNTFKAKTKPKTARPYPRRAFTFARTARIYMGMQPPIRSILQSGSRGILVDAECHISNGLPAMVIVGLGNKAVDEARERVRSAFASSQLVLPKKRITINLAPADIAKDSTSLDLCIALAILQADGQLPIKATEGHVFIGELGLDGCIRGVRGIIGKILAAKQQGVTAFYLPAANIEQAKLVPDITIFPADSLASVASSLRQPRDVQKSYSGGTSLPSEVVQRVKTVALEEISGQEHAKRALAIAAAGGHNLFLSGPPGTGKSMLAKALPSLLPPLSRNEMLEVTHLHSLISNEYDRLITSRPFRAPHHSASHVAIVGGGGQLKPGEVSLSHHGVLFLDEIPEFSRQTIEALRQPLEDRIITITRAKDTAHYPARFILVATANPCPCGYYGTGRPCDCPQYRITQYRQKLSGPIMDRIDLYADVHDVQHEQLLVDSRGSNETKNVIAAVVAARERQHERYGPLHLNADMDNTEIRRYAQLEPEAIKLINQAAVALRLSARSYMRVIKVARTIADLADSKNITAAHATEALRYRPPAHSSLE